MTALVVDASVWVSAADTGDRFCESSRGFLTAAASRRVPIAVPTFVQVEVACALARRLQDAEAGRGLSLAVLRSLATEVHDTDPPLLERAVNVGTNALLRAGDALYAALAERLGGGLVSWDDELIRRADAVTPDTWLAENT